MSALAGAFYFDRHVVSAEECAGACKALGDFGPLTVRNDVAAGLVLIATDTGCLSLARSACTWDGVLHNRDEVIARIGSDDAMVWSDSQLALALYEARGADGLRDLVGDWSLAIWDARAQAMVLASDYAGIRPLHYCRQGERLVWSSSLAGLRAWVKADELDEQYVGDFLTRGLTPNRSPYRNIHPLPAGGFVRVTADRVAKGTFWNLPIGTSVHHTDEREYEEQLLGLFRESVRDRMRTASPVCAELSGGLDSSSVVCMASNLIAEGSTASPELRTFSYREPGSPDEKFVRAVEKFLGLSGQHIEMSTLPLLDPEQIGSGAPVFWGSRFAEIRRRMASLGSNTCLTGQLGDLVMGNWMDDSEQVADHIARGSAGRAVREAFAWSEALRVPVYPILWRAIRANVNRWNPLENGDLRGNASGEDSLCRSFRKKLAASQDTKSRPVWRDASPGRRKHFWAAAEVLEGRHLQCPEALQDVSYTHPFAHRPLVEFMLTIPAEVVCRPGEPRRLMRRAFTGLLPELVVKRRSKASYDTAFHAAVRPLAHQLLETVDQLRVVECGYVDRSSIKARLGQFIQSLDCNEPQLRRVMLLELWMRSRQTGPAGRPQVVPLRDAVRIYSKTEKISCGHVH